MNKIKPYQIWLLFSLITLSAIAIFSLSLPFRGDERHIVETIKLFTENFSFNTIKDYPEVTPPFFFMFYALWGKIFGTSIESLRIFTLIISFNAWQLVFYLFRIFVKKEFHALLLSLMVIVNPYFFGTSVFVFTDMLTILLSLAAIISFIKNKPILFMIFTTLAILCRQYVLIIPSAVMLYSLLIYKSDEKSGRKFILGSIITFLPLLLLFAVWKNISPASGIEKWIIPNSALYNIDYLNAYITFSVIYIFPLVIVFFRKIKPDYKSILIALGVTTLLSFSPIKPSIAALNFTDYKTVGFVHQGLAAIVGLDTLWLKIILAIFLLVGCFINIELIKRFYSEISAKFLGKEKIFILLWILFLVIMPFSYQVWEKYLTMILPFLILSIYLILNPKEIELKN